MKVTDSPQLDHLPATAVAEERNPFAELAERAAATRSSASDIPGVVVGELIAITQDGRTPLVTYPGRHDAAALAARSTVDLRGTHIGKSVVLMFEGGDESKPIVMGVLGDSEGPSVDSAPGRVDIDADGERLVVTARHQLVLQCGRASITLTRAGKILIEGAYISSRSTGVNRIKGGSVQLN